MLSPRRHYGASRLAAGDRPLRFSSQLSVSSVWAAAARGLPVLPGWSLWRCRWRRRVAHATTMATMSPVQQAPGQFRQITVLLYSDDVTVRDAVRLAVGRRPARDIEVAAWRECATHLAVVEAVENQHFDVVILDGEATPMGGMGLCRQLKDEIFHCPPVLVLTGRPQDGWLASWSLADEVVPHPIDPAALATAVSDLARVGAPA